MHLFELLCQAGTWQILSKLFQNEWQSMVVVLDLRINTRGVVGIKVGVDELAIDLKIIPSF